MTRSTDPYRILTFHGPIKPTDTVIKFRTGPLVRCGDVIQFDDTGEKILVILNHVDMQVERGFAGTEAKPLFGLIIDAFFCGTSEKYRGGKK